MNGFTKTRKVIEHRGFTVQELMEAKMGIDTQQLAELAKKYVDLAVDGDDPHVSLYAQVATDAMRLIGSLNSLPDEHQEAS